MALYTAWGMANPNGGVSSPAAPPGCPQDLWNEFQKLQKSKSSGRAAWWRQWEFVLYKAGDTCNGIEVEKPEIKFRHKLCGAEYSTKNVSQFATKHSCVKVHQASLTLVQAAS